MNCWLLLHCTVQQVEPAQMKGQGSCFSRSGRFLQIGAGSRYSNLHDITSSRLRSFQKSNGQSTRDSGVKLYLSQVKIREEIDTGHSFPIIMNDNTLHFLYNLVIHMYKVICLQNIALTELNACNKKKKKHRPI